MNVICNGDFNAATTANYQVLQLINGCRPWDNYGKFTFISDQGSSVVDYFLMSSSFLDFVHTFSVEDRIESDHMPVELYCNFYTDQNAHLGEKKYRRKRKSYFGAKKRFRILKITLHL